MYPTALAQPVSAARSAGTRARKRRSLNAATAVTSGGSVAARRAGAAAALLASSSRASSRATVPQRVSAAARGAALFALATVGALSADAATATCEADDLPPSVCTLQLRRLHATVTDMRLRLASKEAALHEKRAPVEEALACAEEEIEVCTALHARCKRAGDAQAAGCYADEAYVKAQEASKLLDKAGATNLTMDVNRLKAELDGVLRKYKLLRQYTEERHGAEWARKSLAPHDELSYSELRKQAREWRLAQESDVLVK